MMCLNSSCRFSFAFLDQGSFAGSPIICAIVVWLYDNSEYHNTAIKVAALFPYRL